MNAYHDLLTDVLENGEERGDRTGTGTLSVFGGAQIYSLDGRSGLQVNNDGVLMGSGDALGNFTSLAIASDELSIGSTDGAGNILLTDSAVVNALSNSFEEDELRDAINRILGKPWEEVLEPLRAIDQREVAPLQAI